MDSACIFLSTIWLKSHFESAPILGFSVLAKSIERDLCVIDTYDRQLSLIQLVIILVVVGVILWAFNSYRPMRDTIKKILND